MDNRAEIEALRQRVEMLEELLYDEGRLATQVATRNNDAILKQRVSRAFYECFGWGVEASAREISYRLSNPASHADQQLLHVLEDVIGIHGYDAESRVTEIMDKACGRNGSITWLVKLRDGYMADWRTD